MKKIMFLSAVVLAGMAGFTATAQKGQVKLNANYNISTPLGSFKSDVVNKTSFNGVNFGIDYWFNPKFSIGGTAGYQDYYYKWGRQVYSLGKNESISAVLANSIQAVPIMVKGIYSPLGGSDGFAKPYVSLAAGVSLIQYRQYLGEFRNINDGSASFAGQGGAGVIIPVGNAAKGVAVNLGATYNYVPYNRNGINNQNNVGFNAGVTFNMN